MPFALLDWEDGTSSIVNLTSIVTPRKEFENYSQGDEVTARYLQKVYSATIAAIADERKSLEQHLRRPSGSTPSCTTPSGPTASGSTPSPLVRRPSSSTPSGSTPSGSTASGSTPLPSGTTPSGRKSSGTTPSTSNDENNNIDDQENVAPKKGSNKRKKPLEGNKNKKKAQKKTPQQSQKKTTKQQAANHEDIIKRKHLECLQTFSVSSDDDSLSEEECTSASDGSRPSVGGKRPKLIFQDPGCLKCVAMQREKEEIEMELEESQADNQRLRTQTRSLQSQLQHALRRLEQTVPSSNTDSGDDTEMPRAGLVQRRLAEKFKMVELVPGSGVYLSASQMAEAQMKGTRTAVARALMSCFWSNNELCRAGSLTKLPVLLVNSIGVFVCNGLKDMERQKEFANVKRHMRNKVSHLSSLAKKETELLEKEAEKEREAEENEKEAERARPKRLTPEFVAITADDSDS